MLSAGVVDLCHTFHELYTSVEKFTVYVEKFTVKCFSDKKKPVRMRSYDNVWL